MDAGGSSGHTEEGQRLSELRIVLLGAMEEGRSSAGNSILGKQQFAAGIKTVACKKDHGDVAGRRVTLVDTPGWFCYFPAEDSPGLLKDQIVSSVSLCQPGPHVFLLVIKLDSSFQEKHRRAVQGHLELLGATVWRHTVMLFTFGDALREMTIEQHIEREGQALQWLVEKCGSRYHVLSNKDSSEVSQVPELLQKIEKMVAGNGGCHFHMEEESLQHMEDERRITEERANQRARKVREHRETLRQLLRGGTIRTSELKMVLLGWVVGGKSSAGNAILGREEFGVWRRTAQCEKKQAEVSGRRVTVFDTPGWWKFIPAQLTPDWIKQEVAKSLTLCRPGPHAVLLVIPADTSFKEEQRKIIRDNMKHLGEGVWRHTLVLFTWGECLGRGSTIEQHIEREGQALQWLVQKCGNRYHVLSSKKKEHRSQVPELLEKIEEMVAGKTVFDHITETQTEVFEEIEQMDREARSSDLSAGKVPELMQIIDEQWMRREEYLLEKLGLDCKERSNALPPADLLKELEKEWNRLETGLKLKMIPEHTTPPTKAGWYVLETPPGEHVLSEPGNAIEPVGSTGETEKTRIQQWVERDDAVFEKEWSRREWETYNHFRRIIQDHTTPPVRGAASMEAAPSMCGDASSEPDNAQLARACIKVCDWMSENHSEDRAAPSGYDTSSEISNTEASDITGRDEGLEYLGTVDV